MRLVLTCLIAINLLGGCRAVDVVRVPGGIPRHLTAITSEPFWWSEVVGGTLVLKGVEGGRVLKIDRDETTSNTRYIEATDRIGIVVLIVSAGECIDGASGEPRPMSVQLKIGASGAVEGCAE
jgi:uncharacterized membrane protein